MIPNTLNFWLALVSALLATPATAAAHTSRDPAATAAQPRHAVVQCTVEDSALELEELRVPRGGTWSIDYFKNPTARRNSRCASSYGGEDLENLASAGKLPAGTYGAVNGTFFRVHGAGYMANGLIWSSTSGTSEPAAAGRVYAPWRKAGGKSLFVATPEGNYLEPATSADALSRALKKHPRATFALQSGMNLRKTTEFACRPDGPPSWKCNSVARTALCGRRDGSISFYLSNPTPPAKLAKALSPGGACHGECHILLNLDGGGSSQLGYFDRANPEAGGGANSKAGAWKMSGYRLDTTEAGCSPYRPVDHYFLIVKH